MEVIIATAEKVLLSLSPFKVQPTIGGVRLSFSMLFLFVLIRHDAIADNGRLGFICHPKTNDVHKEQCFSHYSAEMNPLMRLYHFLLVTAFILVALWTAMIRYSSIHLQKIRRETCSREREHLWHEFWQTFVLHVGSEAVVLSVILALFCYVQKIYFAETYNCTLNIAPVMTCRDLHYHVKSILNILFIGGMAFILFLCIATIYQAVCNKENFIQELLILNTTENKADDAGNHHINTLRNNANDGSSGFTNTCNHNEQHDTNLDCKRLGKQLGVSNAHIKDFNVQHHDVSEKIAAGSNEWRRKPRAEVFKEVFKNMERKDLLAKKNTSAVHRSFQMKAQAARVLLFCSLVAAGLVIVDKVADNGRLNFKCDPKIDDVLTQECLSRYSAEMRFFIDPNFVVWTMASTLFVSWSAIILYSSRHLPKIRRKTVYREKEHLCHEFWKRFLLHVCCEALVVIVVLLVSICYTQKMYSTENNYNRTLTTALMVCVSFNYCGRFPIIRRKTVYREKGHLCHEFWKRFLLDVCCEAVVIVVALVLFCCTQKMYSTENTYNCTLRNASLEIVVTCTGMHHKEKENVNFIIFGGMLFILVSFTELICYAVIKKEEFIEDLLDLTTGNEEDSPGDDGNLLSDTLRNADVGSSEFTNTNNQSHNERQGNEKRTRWTLKDYAIVMECYYKSRLWGDSGYMKRMHELWIGKGMFDLTKERLAGQARSILKKNFLRKDELKAIRERVGVQEEERESQGRQGCCVIL